MNKLPPPGVLSEVVKGLVELNQAQNKLLKAYQDLEAVTRWYLGEQERKRERKE